MHWNEEDEKLDFEWKEEDEEEISGESSSLSRINPVATVVFLVLLALGAIYFLLRVLQALD